MHERPSTLPPRCACRLRARPRMDPRSTLRDGHQRRDRRAAPPARRTCPWCSGSTAAAGRRRQRMVALKTKDFMTQASSSCRSTTACCRAWRWEPSPATRRGARWVTIPAEPRETTPDAVMGHPRGARLAALICPTFAMPKRRVELACSRGCVSGGCGHVRHPANHGWPKHARGLTCRCRRRSSPEVRQRPQRSRLSTSRRRPQQGHPPFLILHIPAPRHRRARQPDWLACPGRRDSGNQRSSPARDAARDESRQHRRPNDPARRRFRVRAEAISVGVAGAAVLALRQSHGSASPRHSSTPQPSSGTASHADAAGPTEPATAPSRCQRAGVRLT